jgi:hypothetical protein
VQAKLETILYVKRLQTPAGGFLLEPADRNAAKPAVATLRATSAAWRALKYLGAEPPDKEPLKKLLASCFVKESGGFADTPGAKPDVPTTAVGLMAAAELGLPAEPYQNAALRYLAANARSFEDIRLAAAALEQIKAPPPQQVTWTAEVLKLKLPEDEQHGRSRMLASQAVTLLRLGQPLKDAGAIVKELSAGQREDGGYSKEGAAKSDLETTYRVMRAFMMLKAKPPNVDGVRKFIQSCRTADNGYAATVGGMSNVSGVYYAAIITYWLDEMK